MSTPAPAEPTDDPRYLEAEDEATRPGLRQRSQPLIAGLAVLLLLVAAGIAVVRPSSGRSGPAAVKPDPVAITPEAPWDGKQSRRLPITVTPDSGIADGQTVTITGSHFPVGKSVAAVVCTIAAGSKGVDACDIQTSSFMAGTNTTVDAAGNFTISYVMHRHIVVAGKNVDCGAGNVDPAVYHEAVVTFGPMVRITTPNAFSCLVSRRRDRQLRPVGRRAGRLRR